MTPRIATRRGAGRCYDGRPHVDRCEVSISDRLMRAHDKRYGASPTALLRHTRGGDGLQPCRLQVAHRAAGAESADPAPRTRAEGPALHAHYPLGRARRRWPGLLVEARRLIADAEHALSAVENASEGRTGLLRVGFVNSTALHTVPRLVLGLHDQWPSLRLKLQRNTTDVQIEAILEGRLDVGIVREVASHEGLSSRTSARRRWGWPYLRTTIWPTVGTQRSPSSAASASWSSPGGRSRGPMTTSRPCATTPAFASR